MSKSLEDLERALEELEGELAKPPSNPKRIAELSARHKALKRTLAARKKRSALLTELKELEALRLSERDEEMSALVEEERKRVEKELSALEEREVESANAVVEIRAGTGGDEASLFASALFRAYSKFADRKGLKVSVTSVHESSVGGFKEIVALVEGGAAFDLFRFESGVHRVQRVPATEASGRIHTSTATVAVLRERESDGETRVSPDDIRVDTYRASGPGGQYVNKTDSAVRITHLPTGITVACQDERSQHRNREKAMRILKAHLTKLERERAEAESAKVRRSAVGSGDRSEKIRTYNFPQNRLTDHRIKRSWYNLSQVMEGYLDEVVEALHREASDE